MLFSLVGGKNAYSFDNTDAMLTDSARSYINKVKPDFVFLYMVETDEKAVTTMGG